MRQLKITSKVKQLPSLEGVDEEYKFVEVIARKYATSKEQLDQLYLIGLEKAKAFQQKVSKDKYDSNVAWMVEQKIKYSG